MPSRIARAAPQAAPPAPTPLPDSPRRDALLQAAVGVFMRYGYKKTSMDDLANAGGVSRQGLYLHFPTKEALFHAAVTHLAERSVQAVHAALAQTDVDIEARLLAAFLAFRAQSGSGEMSQELMSELFTSARLFVGPVIEDLDRAIVQALAEALQSSGVAAHWIGAELSAQQLAQHLSHAAHGIKHQARTTEAYCEQMRVAIRIVCAGRPPAPARVARTASTTRKA